MKCNIEYYERFGIALQDRGVMRPIDPMEPWFISYSHTEKDINESLNIIEDAIKAEPYKEH
jgi:glutamate-1-semialdehyde aminotransferase